MYMKAANLLISLIGSTTDFACACQYEIGSGG